MAKTLIQPVSGTQHWRERMLAARVTLKGVGIGSQKALNWIISERPSLDTLTFWTRWKNAWSAQNADPEFTEMVEQAAAHFKAENQKTRQRLGRQRLRPGM